MKKKKQPSLVLIKAKIKITLSWIISTISIYSKNCVKLWQFPPTSNICAKLRWPSRGCGSLKAQIWELYGSSNLTKKVFPKMPVYSTNVWWKFKLNVIHITFDLPKQTATPKFGIQVVLTTEPKPVTVCATEPSCRMNIKWEIYIWVTHKNSLMDWYCWLGSGSNGQWCVLTCKDQMLSNPPIPPETRASPLEQNESDFTAVMWPWSTNTHFALSCCRKKQN